MAGARRPGSDLGFASLVASHRASAANLASTGRGVRGGDDKRVGLATWLISG